MYKYLVDAGVFNQLNKLPEEFKEEEFVKIVNNVNYNKLLDTVLDIEKSRVGYSFNEKYFKAALLKYINKIRSIPIIRKREKYKVREQVKR